MARLLVEWLNDEVRLSRLVTSLDHDFCDGYLIGELLHKYNQQSNFHEFLNTGAADAKIKNFCLLEPTMRQIGVHYNSRIAQDIMNAKPSVMKTLLYEIRTTLDIIIKRSAAVMNHNTRTINNGSTATTADGQQQQQDDPEDPEKPKKILCVIQPSRPLYDKTMSITFENAVRSMMENPNDVMMAHATRRFQERKRALRLSASVGLNDELEHMQNDLQTRKQMDRQRRKHEMEFQEAWDLRNREQWQKNQTIARDRRALEQKVVGKARSQAVARVVHNQQATRDNTFKSIDDFENKLKSAIFRDCDQAPAQQGGETAGTGVTGGGNNMAGMLKTIGGNPGTGIPELTYLDQTVLKNNLIHAQKTIKEHHQHMTHHQALHGRRRRKFVRENESTRTSLLVKQAEEEIVSQILDPCVSEIQEQHDHRRVLGHVEMIRDNGENRQVLLTSVLEADGGREMEFRAQEAHHELHWIVAQRMNSQCVRADVLEQAQAAASRFDALAMMESEVERILDLADWVVASRAFGLLNISTAEAEAEKEQQQVVMEEGAAKASVAASKRPITPVKGGKGGAGAASASASASVSAAASAAVSPRTALGPNPNALTTGLLPGPLWKVVKAMYCSKFDLSEALPYPQKTYVHSHLPNSLSQQPLCVDTAALVRTPFTGADLFTAGLDITPQILSVPSLDRAKSFFVNHHYGDSEGFNDLTRAPVPNTSEGVSVGNPNGDLSDYLAYSDSWEFSEHLLQSEDLGGDTVLTLTTSNGTGTRSGTATGTASAVGTRPGTASASSAPVTARSGKADEEIADSGPPPAMTITRPPEYLFTTPPKYLLGELLLDVSCTHMPLPHDPAPDVTIDVTAMPLKLALAGPSDLGKSMLAQLLKDRLGVRVFNCEELIHQAVADYENSLTSSAEEEEPEPEPEPEQLGKAITTPAPATESQEEEIDDQEEGQGEGEQAERVREAKADLALNQTVHSFLQSGAVLPDEVYISLIVRAINRLTRELERNKPPPPPLLSMDGDDEEEEDEDEEFEDGGGGAAAAAEQGEFGFDDPQNAGAALADMEDITTVSGGGGGGHGAEAGGGGDGGFNCPGYVLEDFPTTANQALLLFQALSGYDYTKPRPQPVDRASKYAPPAPTTRTDYDVSKCGLDAVYYIDAEGAITSMDGSVGAGGITEAGSAGTSTSAIAAAAAAESMDTCLQERISARIDISNDGKQMFLHEDVNSVVTLVEPYTPLHPIHTCGLDITVCNQESSALKKLLVYMKLYRPRGICSPARVNEMAEAVVTELEETLALAASRNDDNTAAGTSAFPIINTDEDKEGTAGTAGNISDQLQEGADEDNSICFVDNNPNPNNTKRPPLGKVNSSTAGNNNGGNGSSSSASDHKSKSSNNITGAAGVKGDDVSNSAPASGTVTPAAPVPAFVPQDYLQISTLPVPLAKALAECWSVAEKASDASSCSFAMAMRELKYQMLQRRRGVHDTVVTILTKLDKKQMLLEEFRDQFNSFSLDFRFDPECQAELHLRALELRDAYWTLCEERKDAAEAYVARLTGDATTAVMQWRTQCEGAAMVQSELNRYIAAVQIILDYTKAVSGYTSSDQQLGNELEDTVGGEETGTSTVGGKNSATAAGGAGNSKGAGKDSKGGKDKKGKGGSGNGGGPPVPYRIPVGSPLLSASVADELPAAVDPTLADGAAAETHAAPVKSGKGAKGGGKGGASAAADASTSSSGGKGGDLSSPLDEAIHAALEASKLYAQETGFFVNRELYGGDEGLCMVVENAIWYETRKFRRAVGLIKSTVEEQVQLCDVLEADIQTRMKKVISDTQLKELSVCERVIAMIQEHITVCEPIALEWLIAPDAISITTSHLVYQPPVQDPEFC